MKKIFLVLLSILFLVSCSSSPEFKALTSTGLEVNQTQNFTTTSEFGSANISIDAKKMISDSPRHQEWVEIDNNGKTIHAFVVYPENKAKSSVVIMIHENKWLTDWVRDMADQVAAEWYIVITPDLLSDFDAKRKKTSDFATPDDATQALYTLSPEQVRSDLDAVTVYAKTIDSYNGNLVSAGFCWGGSQAFSFAKDNTDLKASLVFYGTGPEDATIYEDINIPVYGFYAENDERVNSTIEETEKRMLENQKTFEYKVYKGVWHAFMRSAQSDDVDEVSKESRAEAFERMKEILQKYN